MARDKQTSDEVDKSEKDKGREKKEKGGFLELIGFGRKDEASEDAIKEMVADNTELEPAEKRMIHEILDLRDMSAHEIMKPRVDMIMVEDEETVQTTLDRMRGTGYSRLPVFHDDIDGIVGIVHYKDLIGPLMDGRTDEAITKYMYEPMFVPETKNVIALLGEMQDARQQMAIVVDEYGGTDGLLTIEDIVEEIVGEIQDETDFERVAITRLNDHTWRVDGRFPVQDALDLGWPVTDSDDYETIAGWIMGDNDTVPQTGDKFNVEGFTFTVERMRRSRIVTVRVEKNL